jgi:hypothetical protein
LDFKSSARRFSSAEIVCNEQVSPRAARLQPGLSATADGKALYFTPYDRQSVIKMMEFAP